MVQELHGVRIGMTPLEVKLSKGKPDIEFPDAMEEPTEEDKQSPPWWVYKVNRITDAYITVGFEENSEGSLYVEEICQRKSNHAVLGIAARDSESEVKDRLGEPSHISIHSDGLSKYISYERWNVTYEIKKGKVWATCISESGQVTFNPEYGEESDPD